MTAMRSEMIILNDEYLDAKTMKLANENVLELISGFNRFTLMSKNIEHLEKIEKAIKEYREGLE